MTTYIFYHYIAPWILPPGMQIFLALSGFILYRFYPRISKLFIATSVITLWLASAPIVAYHLLEILQNRYPALQSKALTSIPFTHGAIVVLGGGSDISVEKNHTETVSENTLNRLRYASYLFNQLHLPLIVSGGREPGSANSEAHLMLKTLQEDFAVTTALKEDQSLNTLEESQYVAALLKQNHMDGILLVTNAWHMPRSVMSFERAGIHVIPAPMGYKVYDHHYTLLSYFPNVQALEATCIVLHEWLGMLWYQL